MKRNQTPEVVEIASGFESWSASRNLWKVIKTCPLSTEGLEEGSAKCCDHLSCGMQTQTNCGKCGYEVLASYQFLLGHLGLLTAIPGQKHWNKRYTKLSEYEKTTVLDIAINKALMTRCDIEMGNKGVLVKEITDKFHKGELVSNNVKWVENPAVQLKERLSKINRELGKTINISERDQDDKKAKLKQFGMEDAGNGPLSKFMSILDRASQGKVPKGADQAAVARPMLKTTEKN